ncbi:MAG: DUF5996 family protein [Actinomycetota bacterium]|nr:DUF5996 family protein [Actinomycetota bacterium]
MSAVMFEHRSRFRAGLYLLRYEDARTAPNPSVAISEFFTSTYDALALLMGWDQALVEPVPAR